MANVAKHLSTTDLIVIPQESGSPIRVRLSTILPDGSRLTDKINHDQLQSILIAAELERKLRKTDSASPAILNSMLVLIHWMNLNGIYRFQDLNAKDTERFQLESSFGFDYLIKASERTVNAIMAMARRPNGDGEKRSVHTVFDEARISRTHVPKLHKATALAKAFVAHGTLPKEGDETPEIKHLNDGAIFARLAAVRILWHHRKHLPDPLQFDTLSGRSSGAQNPDAPPSGQTKSIPVDLLARILTGAFDWILRIGPALVELDKEITSIEGRSSQQVEKISNLLMAFTVRYRTEDWPGPLVRKAATERPGLLMRSALHQFIPVACTIAIFAMTARRKSEVYSLKTDCLEGTEGQRYLRMYIAKLAVHDDATVCPEIVAKAVELMLAYRSLESGVVTSLWPEARGKDRSTRRILEAYFDDFSIVVGASQYSNKVMTSNWHYACHQFRRAFAIIYVWRFEGPLLSLQHHFRHTDWKQIFTYIQDKEIHNEVLGQHVALTAAKLRGITEGSTKKPAGKYSVTLEKIISRARHTLELCDDELLSERIEAYALELGLVFKPNIWGFCAARAGASSLRRAACQSKENPTRSIDRFFNTPDPQGSSEEICSGCVFHFTDESRETHWRTEKRRVNDMLHSCRDEDAVREPLEKRAKALNAFVERFFDEK